MDYFFSYLKESQTGKNVAVNPRLVRMIYQQDDRRVEIVFDNSCRITIDGNVGSVVDHLRLALGDNELF